MIPMINTFGDKLKCSLFLLEFCNISMRDILFKKVGFDINLLN